MKKNCFFILVFTIGMEAACAQSPQSRIQQVDNTVKTLAMELNKKLIEEQAKEVAFGRFAYENTAPPLVSYLVNQLTYELANISNKPYIILPNDATSTDWTIAGEVIDVSDMIRVYIQLIRQSNHSIGAMKYANLERNEDILDMLGTRSGASFVVRDAREPDSWDNPVSSEIGIDGQASATAINRSIHNGNDEDFFLLAPEKDGRLVMETMSNMDTYMTFYNFDTKEALAEDDDSGDGGNARIRHNVEAGKRYMAKVRGYGEVTGVYSFIAYFSPPREGTGSWESPIPYAIGRNENATVAPHSIEESDDKGYFLLVPETNGRLIMETVSHIDTYMELYDLDTKEKLSEDDDGGDDANAQIRYNVRAGKRYIAIVQGYGGSVTGNYGFRAYLQVAN